MFSLCCRKRNTLSALQKRGVCYADLPTGRRGSAFQAEGLGTICQPIGLQRNRGFPIDEPQKRSSQLQQSGTLRPNDNKTDARPAHIMCVGEAAGRKEHLPRASLVRMSISEERPWYAGAKKKQRVPIQVASFARCLCGISSLLR